MTHQIETFSALLAIWAGNSPFPGEFPAQRPATPVGHGQGYLGQMAKLLLQYYKSRQVHQPLNGLHPYIGYRDLRSAKSRPNLYQIWHVLVHGQAHVVQMGKWR